MQVLIQVVSSKGESLRKKIANDRKLQDFDLQVTEQKQMGRSPGWMKLHSLQPDKHGAINIEWIESARTLLCRVVTRQKGKPHEIIGDFISYLLARHRFRIETISIIPCRKTNS
jgi:ribosomal protein L16/L10AE